MLVSEEHAVEMFGTGAAEGFEAAEKFFFPESGVNEDSGASGFEQCAIARAARGQNGNAKRDANLRCVAAGMCPMTNAEWIIAKRGAGVNMKERKGNVAVPGVTLNRKRDPSTDESVSGGRTFFQRAG
jgi:hypothetical protein